MRSESKHSHKSVTAVLCWSFPLPAKVAKGSMPVPSSIALGIRKNFALLAASDFGMVILRDISASTIICSEIRTAATIILDIYWAGKLM